MPYAIKLRGPVLLSALLLALVLCGCAAPVAETAAPEPTPVPTATPIPRVDLGGVEAPLDAEVLALENEFFTVDLLVEHSDKLTCVREIDLGRTELKPSELERILEAYPDAEVHWIVDILGEELPGESETLDLSELRPEDVETVCAALRRMIRLRSIDLIPESGITQLEPREVDLLQAAAPQAQLDCCFELYGQLASWQTEELRYSKQKLGDGAIEVFRSVLPYLRSLKLLRMYACGIEDHDAMAQLKNDFPDVNIVWSVKIAGYNFMTDTVLFHCPLLRDQHVELLKYLTEVEYLDVGHNRFLTTIDFARYFPKLTVIILSITKISDISALAECPELEFVELLNTHISDLTPLSGLKKIEYLNIGYMPYLRELKPIYGLTSLKMVRVVGPYNYIKDYMVEELKAALPDAFISTNGGDPSTSGYWRFDKDHNYTERYALLRQQMLYDVKNWQDRQQNSPTRLEGDIER